MNLLISPWLRSYLTVANPATSPLTRQASFMRAPLRSQNFANHLVQRYVTEGKAASPRPTLAQGALSATGFRAVPASPNQPTITPILPVLEEALVGPEAEIIHGPDPASGVQPEFAAELPQVLAGTVHPVEQAADTADTLPRSPAQLSAELRKTLRRTQQGKPMADAEQAKTASPTQPHAKVAVPTPRPSEPLPPLSVATPVLSASTGSPPATAIAAISLVDEIEHRVQRAAPPSLRSQDASSSAALAAPVPAQPASAESGVSLVDELERRIHQAAQRRLDGTAPPASRGDDAADPDRAGRLQRRPEGQTTTVAAHPEQPTLPLGGRKPRNTKIYSQVEELKRFTPEQTNSPAQPTPPPRQASSSAGEAGAGVDPEPPWVEPPGTINRKPMLAGESAHLAQAAVSIAARSADNTIALSPAESPAEEDGPGRARTLPTTDPIQRTGDGPVQPAPTLLGQAPLPPVMPPLLAAKALSGEQDQAGITPATTRSSAPGAKVTNGSEVDEVDEPDHAASRTRAALPEQADQSLPADQSVPSQPPLMAKSAAATELSERSATASQPLREQVIPGAVSPADHTDDGDKTPGTPAVSASGRAAEPIPQPEPSALIDHQLILADSQANPGVPAAAAREVGFTPLVQRRPAPREPIHPAAQDNSIRALPVGDQPAQPTAPLASGDHSTVEGMKDFLPTARQPIEPAVVANQEHDQHAELPVASVSYMTPGLRRVAAEKPQLNESRPDQLTSAEQRIQRTLAAHKTTIATLLRSPPPPAARVARQALDEPAPLPSVLDLAAQPLAQPGTRRSPGAPDLDQLARQITPLVKRLLRVEREREPF